MRTLLTAGLAGLFLSGTATAQDDWTFIACEFEIRTVGPWAGADGPQPQAQRATFRFNETDFANFSNSEVRWYSLCLANDVFDLGADCTITSETVEARRRGVGIDEVLTINRLSGRYTMRQRYDGSADGFDAEGQCAPVADPTAGQRRF